MVAFRWYSLCVFFWLIQALHLMHITGSMWFNHLEDQNQQFSSTWLRFGRFVMVNLNFIDIPIWDNYYVNISYQNIMIIFAVFPILKFIFKCLDSIYMPLPIKKSFFRYVMLKCTLIPSNINTLEQYLFISTLQVLLKACWAFTADAELSTILRLAWIWK